MTVNIKLDYWVDLPEPEQTDLKNMVDPVEFHKFLMSKEKIIGDCSVYFKSNCSFDWEAKGRNLPDIQISNSEEE